MPPLRVILAGRVNLHEKPGGDTEQIVQTARALERRGIRAQAVTELETRLDGADLVHLFNVTRPAEALYHLERAARCGVPCVLTAIHHDLREYNARGRRGPGRWAARLLGNDRLETLRVLLLGFTDHRLRPAVPAQLTRGHAGARIRLLEGVRRVICASETEERDLARLAGPLPTAIVPLGVDSSFESANPRAFHELCPAREFLLTAARIEDLKNQCGMLEALEGFDVPIVFAGAESPAHGGYARRLRELARRRRACWLLPPLSRPLVASAMAAARVHAMTGWVENVGLSSLEAAAAGAAVVSTDRGYLRDYLGDSAFYCDPADPASMLAAVRGALDTPRDRLRSREAVKPFTWDAAAARLERVYAEALA